MIYATIYALLATQAQPFPEIRSADRTKTGLSQAKTIMSSCLRVVYPTISYSDEIPIFREEPELGLAVWERDLTDQKKCLSWSPKGIIALISTDVNSSTSHVKSSGEARHSRAEAQIVVDRLKKEFGIPDLYKANFRRSFWDLVDPQSWMPRDRFFFSYAPTPPGFMYPDPGQSFSVMISADTLAVEEFRVSDIGITPTFDGPYKAKISKDEAISMAKIYESGQGDPNLKLIEESVGLAYVFPRMKDGVVLDFPSETKRPAYRIAFTNKVELSVDAETGEILSRFMYR